MEATRAMRRAAVTALALIALSGCALSAPAASPLPSASGQPSSTNSASPTPTMPAFDRTLLSNDDPNSLWVISNKHRPLNPADFAPSDLSMPVGVPNEFTQPLREAAARAVETM